MKDIVVVTFEIDREKGDIRPSIPAGVSIGHLLMIGKILDLVTTDLLKAPQEDRLQIARTMPLT